MDTFDTLMIWSTLKGNSCNSNMWQGSTASPSSLSSFHFEKKVHQKSRSFSIVPLRSAQLQLTTVGTVGSRELDARNPLLKVSEIFELISLLENDHQILSDLYLIILWN